MTELLIDPPDVEGSDCSQFTCPADLQPILHKLETVYRYADGLYAPGILHDTTAVHTRRLACRFGVLEEVLPPEVNFGRGERMSLLHDQDEQGLAANGSSAYVDDEGLQGKPVPRAKPCVIPLSAEDEELFLEFKAASAFLKGKEVEREVTPEALIIKVLDHLDGNVLFHTQLVRWILSERFSPDDMPPVNALIYTFDTTHDFIARILENGFSDEVTLLCIGLLENQLAYVVRTWEQVRTVDNWGGTRLMPEVIGYLVAGCDMSGPITSAECSPGHSRAKIQGYNEKLPALRARVERIQEERGAYAEIGAALGTGRANLLL